MRHGGGRLAITFLVVIGGVASSPRTAAADTGRWTPAGLSGRVVQLLVDPADPRTILASAEDGVFRTTDGGDSWTLVLPDDSWIVAGGNPRIVWAARDGQLRRSADGGATWALGPSSEFSPVAVDAQVSTTLYSVVGEGFAKSVDGGETWNPVNVGLPVAVTDVQRPPWERTIVRGRSILVSPLAVYGVVLHASIDLRYGDESLFVSTDGAQTWRSTGLGTWALQRPVVSAANPSILYAGGLEKSGPSFITVSRDAGETWKRLPSDAFNSSPYTKPDLGPLAVDPENALVLYAGLRMLEWPPSGNRVLHYDVLRSADGGYTWSSTHAALESELYELVVTATDPCALFALTDAGLYRFQAPGTGPDLTGSWQTLKGACHAPGQPNRKRCKLAGALRIRNAGATRLDRRTIVRLYASADEWYDDDDTLIGEKTVTKLGAGRSRRFAFRVKTNAAALHVIAKIDAANAAEETDEGNNLIVSSAGIAQ